MKSAVSLDLNDKFGPGPNSFWNYPVDPKRGFIAMQLESGTRDGSGTVSQFSRGENLVDKNADN